jgi:hypothetical protein
VDDQCRALFASSLQRSDAAGAEVVAEAIRVTVQQLGTDGCIGRMAQEFGDHPEAAAARIRWVRSLLICPKTITARSGNSALTYRESGRDHIYAQIGARRYPGVASAVTLRHHPSLRSERGAV